MYKRQVNNSCFSIHLIIFLPSVQLILENKFIEIENAFKGNLRTYFYKNNNNVIKDICLLLIYLKLEILNILSNI